MGIPLERGSAEDGILTFHWHHARFDLESGCTFDLWADDVPTFPADVRKRWIPCGATLLRQTDAVRSCASWSPCSVCREGGARFDSEWGAWLGVYRERADKARDMP